MGGGCVRVRWVCEGVRWGYEPFPACPQLIAEFRKATQIDRSKGLLPVGVPNLRRGSEMVPESRDLPKMTLADFKLIVVLGKGSFGKVRGVQ